MVRKSLCSLFLFLVLGTWAFAQDEDLQSATDSKVDKMKKELKLTEAQADAVEPIIKDYLVKRNAFLEEINGQGIVDHVSVKSTLSKLRDIEDKKLAKILNPDQMEKWTNKENLMASLNPDSMGSSWDDDSTGITPEGANFKF